MSQVEKLNQIVIFRIGEINSQSKGKFLDFIEMSTWLALALCGDRNQYLLAQTSKGFEMLRPTSEAKFVINEAVLSLFLNATPLIENLLQLAFLENEIDAFKCQNGFVVDWDTPVKTFAPCIFCAKEFLDSNFDVLLNTDYLELSFDGDKFFSVEDLPFFSNGQEGGVFGVTAR